MSKHTKGKCIIERSPAGAVYIMDEDQLYIATVHSLKSDKMNEGLSERQEANAARLVKCWNMHQELVEMIRTLRMSIYHYREAGTLIHMTENGEGALKNLMDESLKLLKQSEQ